MPTGDTTAGGVSAGHGHSKVCRGAGSCKAHVRTYSQGDYREHGCDKAQVITVARMPGGGHGHSKAHWGRAAKKLVGPAIGTRPW